MKKSIIALILSIALLVCMTACSGSKDPEPTPGGNTPPSVTQTIYEKLDGLADLNYQQIKLSIVMITGDIELSANYTLTQCNVSYSVEQLNILPVIITIESLIC